MVPSANGRPSSPTFGQIAQAAETHPDQDRAPVSAFPRPTWHRNALFRPRGRARASDPGVRSARLLYFAIRKGKAAFTNAKTPPRPTSGAVAERRSPLLTNCRVSPRAAAVWSGMLASPAPEGRLNRATSRGFSAGRALTALTRVFPADSAKAAHAQGTIRDVSPLPGHPTGGTGRRRASVGSTVPPKRSWAQVRRGRSPRRWLAPRRVPRAFTAYQRGSIPWKKQAQKADHPAWDAGEGVHHLRPEGLSFRGGEACPPGPASRRCMSGPQFFVSRGTRPTSRTLSTVARRWILYYQPT